MRGWSLRGEPFSVQAEALRQSEDRKGFCWFMEQGLGKTPVALEEFVTLQHQGLVDELVVICPNSLKGNWVEQAAIWEAPVEFRMWNGPKDWKPGTFRGNASIFNYESMIGSGGTVIESLLESRRCLLVLDESQRIKNPTSAVTRAVLGHYAKHAQFKRALSGTPMTNTVVDLWPQLRFAGAMNGSNPIVFKKRYGIEVAGFKGMKKLVGVKNEEELQEIIAQWGFRATKAEWAKELPEKLYREPIRVPLPDSLRGHYQTMLDEFVVMLSDEHAVVAEAVAGQYLKLQQISSGFIYEGKEAHRLIETKKLPKFRALMDVIDANGSSSKTIVFAHFRPTCHELIATIEAETGQTPAYLIGGMKDADIQAQKDAFNSASGPQVMVLQLSAGKEGHTLLGDQTSNPCHTVCYFEMNFNLGDRVQSEDRPHRWGQKNPVLYVDFSSSPIETLVIRAYQKKKELVDYLIDNKARLTKD